MKKILKIILLVILTINLSAKDKDNINVSPMLENNNTLKIGTNVGYQPFEYLNMRLDVIGFDIDLLKEISKRVNFKFEMINMKFDQLLPALQADKIDMAIAALGITKYRLINFNFSKPYFFTRNIYIKQSINNSIKNKKDLVGKKIGVIKNTIQVDSAKTIKGVKIIEFETNNKIIEALSSGIIDAMITDNAVGIQILRKYTYLSEFFIEPGK